MLLTQVVQNITSECDIGQSTISQYERAERRFSTWLGHPAHDDDLTRNNLNNFIKHIQDRRSNTTASQYRRSLCRMWNYLTEASDKPAYEIKRLRRPKVEVKPVIAWSMEDLDALLKGASELKGKVKCGVPAASFVTALLWFAYDTGLRPSDIFLIRFADIDFENRSVCITQHKTKMPHIVFLDDPAIEAIRKIQGPKRDLVFPVQWSGIRRWMDRTFRNAAEYGFVRVRGKNLGTLRKTNATQIFITLGEAAAAESLGHVSGTYVARRHYIDHRARRQYTVPTRPNAAYQQSGSRQRDCNAA